MNDTTTEVKPALYVGTYAKYNNGSIAGKWLYLEDYADTTAFLKACEELHKDESDPELMFQDFEGFPKEFYSESCSIVELDKLYEWVNMDIGDRSMVEEYCDATGESLDDIGDLEEINDRLYCILDYTYSSDDNNAMGDYILENELIEVPESLQGYIDTQSLGRDWLQDMYVSSNGYVFTNN
jgi:antirestriction protein